MPLIHHPLTRVEADVDETQARILTTNPRVPWLSGPLPRPAAKRTTTKPTAATNPTPDEGDNSLTEED